MLSVRESGCADRPRGTWCCTAARARAARRCCAVSSTRRAIASSASTSAAPARASRTERSQHNTTAHLLGRPARTCARTWASARWLVVGGSWGATLALLHALDEPDAVSALLLRAHLPGARRRYRRLLHRRRTRRWPRRRRPRHAARRAVGAAAARPRRRAARLRAGLVAPRAAMARPATSDVPAATPPDVVHAGRSLPRAGPLPAPAAAGCSSRRCWHAARMCRCARRYCCTATMIASARPTAHGRCSALLSHAALHWVGGAGHDPSHPAMVDAMVRALDALRAAQGHVRRDRHPRDAAALGNMTLRLKIQLIVVRADAAVPRRRALTLQYRAVQGVGRTRRWWPPTAWPRNCSTAPHGVYAAQGTPAMLAFLQGVGRIRSNEVTLFDAAGRELYRSPPSPYKAGRDAPDWFVDADHTAHDASRRSQFPDGKLEVRANASRAALDAWDHCVDLVAGALAAAGGRQRAGVLAGRPRGASRSAQIVDALDAAGGRATSTSSLPALHGIEANAHRRRVQPHGGRAAARSSRPSGARCAPRRNCPTAASWRAGSTTTSSRSAA